MLIMNAVRRPHALRLRDENPHLFLSVLPKVHRPMEPPMTLDETAATVLGADDDAGVDGEDRDADKGVASAAAASLAAGAVTRSAAGSSHWEMPVLCW